jgi:fermentation-respiration switch protein FrsA (DUF1100 family)
MGVDIQFSKLDDSHLLRKKSNPVKKVIIMLIILFISFNALGLYFGNDFYNRMFVIEKDKNTNPYEAAKSTFNENRLTSLQREDISVSSKFDYKIRGTYIKNSKPTKNTVIILHGMYETRWNSMKYADLYLDHGFNVLIYDSRACGTSGGNNISYGYCEQYDLDSVVTWLQKKNKDGIIGVHGVSFGASTAIMHSQIDSEKNRVKFYVADSSFSDLDELIKLKLKEYYKIDNPIIQKLAIFYSNKVTSLRAGFNFDNVSPLAAVKKSKAPILFIHSKADLSIPAYMSENLYKAKTEKKELYLSLNTGHASSLQYNKNEYKQKLYEFIDSIMSK